MPQEFWLNALFSVIPTVLLIAIFVFVMRSIFRADRTARRVYERIEAEERHKAGLAPKPRP